jgi:hypothetical protein
VFCSSFFLATVPGFSPLSFTLTHTGLAKLGSGLRGTLRGYLYARNEQLARGFVAYADGVLLHRPTSSDRLCITKIYLHGAHVPNFGLKFDKKLHILVEMRNFIQFLLKKKMFGSNNMYSECTWTFYFF